MPLIHVSSLDDARLDPYARLTEAQLRSKLEPANALFIAESGKVIERAFAGGMEPMSLLMEEKWVESMTPLIEQMERAHPDLAVLVAPREELARLTGFELTRGALRSVSPPRPALGRGDRARRAAHRRAREHHQPHQRRRDLPLRRRHGRRRRLGDADLLRPVVPPRRARVDGDGVPGSVDAHRRGGGVRRNADERPRQRTSGHPAITWAETGVPLLRELGFTTAAMALSDDSVSLDDPALERADKLALVFGTEGDGSTPRPSRHATARCASPWRTAWTRSTWPPQAPWRFGSSEPSQDTRSPKARDGRGIPRSSRARRAGNPDERGLRKRQSPSSEAPPLHGRRIELAYPSMCPRGSNRPLGMTRTSLQPICSSASAVRHGGVLPSKPAQ